MLASGCHVLFPLDGDGPADTLPPEGGPGSDGPTVDGPLACPQDYTIVGAASRYKLSFGDPQPFGENATGGAAKACVNDGMGNTHLLVLENDAELDLISDESADRRWIGHRRTSGGGPFFPVSTQVVVDYPPLSGPPWAENEPTDNELCAALDADGQLVADNCSLPYEYICECDEFPPGL